MTTSTVYFTSYKGHGYPTRADIPPDVERANARKCDGLASAIARMGDASTGVWKGTWEPSYVLDHVPAPDAVKLARAACALWDQDAALVFTPCDASGATHVRVTTSKVSAMAAHYRADGYTVRADGTGVFILPIADYAARPEVTRGVEYGRADFVTGQLVSNNP